MGGVLYAEQGEVIIELKKICRNYNSGSQLIEALKEIDLEIKQGEFVGIMGPSASGKSTLLNVMGCLDTPSQGEYRLKNKNITELSRAEKAQVRNQVFGFVFQSFNLLPELDVHANVALPLKYGKVPKHKWNSMIEEALELVGLKEVGHRYPDQLSGGQQQRVAIARALVNHPDIILADEPTGSLDTATSQGIMEVLRILKETLNRTVVVITHDARIAGYADRILRIEDGRIKEDLNFGKNSLGQDHLFHPFGEMDQEEYHENIL